MRRRLAGHFMKYVFYDFETTGISPAFDQPLQFGAVLTDAQFNEIDRVELRCKLAPHIIPSPYALVVTGLSPEQIVDPALPELFEFSQSIMDLIDRWTPATWIGYNSMKFDEEVLRQTLYQNLQPNIYATQTNGNSRMDMLTVVYAVWCRNRKLLNWPTNTYGGTSFKLDQLAPQNGFGTHNAHDALGDVEATLHLARMISKGDHSLWSSFLFNRNKRSILRKLGEFPPVAIVSRDGSAPPKTYIGCFCGTLPGNTSSAVFFNLQAGDPEVIGSSDEKLNLNLAEGASKITFSLPINKTPAIFSIHDPAREHVERAGVIAKSPSLRATFLHSASALFSNDKAPDAVPVEKQIYGKFYSNSDRALLQEFQSSDWISRRKIVNLFEDARLRQLGRRLIAYYRKDLLTEREAMQFKNFIKERWTATDTKTTEWTTIYSAKKSIIEIREKKIINKESIDSIENFINHISTNNTNN